jgi:predicted O-linked N-acetylglucosamine transferase (SPINDLY family)
VFKQQGQDEHAVACYRAAVSLRRDYVEAHNNLGAVLQKLGKSDEAVSAYNAAVKSRPGYVEAWFNLGVVLHEKQDLEASAAAYRAAIDLRSDIAVVHNNLGTVLQALGRIDEAAAAYRDAIAAAPAFAEPHYNRGVMLQQQGRLDEALAAYVRAVALRADYPDAVNRAGIVLQELGRPREAIAVYGRLLQSAPDHVDALNNVGAALLADGRPDEALEALQRSLALKADLPEAWYNIGNARRELGELEAAIEAYKEALRLRPDYPEAFSQLTYHRWRVCDWDDRQASEERLVGMVRSGGRVPPFYLLSTSATAADQLICAQRWLQPLTPSPREISSCPATRHGRIRIGYLSGDFQQHATSHLIAGLFEHHDRDRFELIAYSYGRDDQSPMGARVRRSFDRFVDIGGMSHREAAERIRADETAILIDLKGHTHNGRPQIAAHRPAPIQVNYLGYPGTVGADFIDYIIVDEVIAPASQQPFFAERLVHLPHCYQVNDRLREIAATVPSRAECGLPSSGFVFCSFNNSYKITPAFFGVWMRLLEAVPGSVLWLLRTSEPVVRNLRIEAERRGVDPDRLIFAPIVPAAEHLARHRNADLFLDTLPCNAHTTASDALWAGLPVLTCIGHTFAGRVAASLLMASDLPELVAASIEDYERQALALARDPVLLARFRAKLQDNRDASALFDLPRFTKGIEQAYVRMWDAWCSGRTPAGFAVEM